MLHPTSNKSGCSFKRVDNRVSRSKKASYAVACRYAIALIELAEEAGKLPVIEQNLNDLAAMMAASADLLSLIQAPVMNRAAQAKALMALADKAQFDRITKNFLCVLIDNRRLPYLASLIEAVKQEISVRRGEVTVQVETAQDMTEAQKKALQEALTKGMGREVRLKAKVEPGILGGMIVTVGSKMIDDSVRRKLERMRIAMSGQANENLELTRMNTN